MRNVPGHICAILLLTTCAMAGAAEEPSSSAAIVVSVYFDGNGAPVVNDQAFSVVENSSPGTSIGIVQARDDDGDTLSYAITAGNAGDAFVIDPASGELTVTGSAELDHETTPSYGLTVEVTDDGTPILSDTATVTITVLDVNEPPEAKDDTNETDEDTVLIVPPPGVLGNDDDPDESDTLTVSAYDATSTKGARVTVNSDGAYTYDPTESTALQALSAGQTDTDTFSYTVSDGHGGVDTATVAITVTGLDDTTVPDVVGMTRDEAETALEDAGLGVGVEYETVSSEYAEGHVAGQAPQAGLSVAPGTLVDLTVSLGYEPPETFFVDVANDTGVEDGTAAHPFNTIAEAIEASLPGRRDTIKVLPGTYRERLVLKTHTTLQSTEGAYHTHVLAPEGVGKNAQGLVTLPDEAVLCGFSIGLESADAAVLVGAGASAELTNCVLYDCDVALYADADARVTAVNNTFRGNTSAGIAAGIGAILDVVKNNVFATNGTTFPGTAQEASHNAVFDSEGDAGFVDASNLNFHLRSDSPCRDAGDPDAAYADKNGTTNDQGADGGPDGVLDFLVPLPVIEFPPGQRADGGVVIADGSGSTDEWGIARYSWDVDLADGIQEDYAGPAVTHEFVTSGRYSVTLTVWDHNGLWSQKTETVEVGGGLPTAFADADPIAGQAPLTVHFYGDGDDPDGGTVTFAWDFDNDGVPDDTVRNPVFTYPSGSLPGLYRAVLTVTDDEGATSLAVVHVTITEEAPIAAETILPGQGGTVGITEPSSALAGLTVEIPAGATTGEIVVTISELTNPPPLPPGSIGVPVLFGPAGTVFTQPVTVTMPVPEGMDASSGLDVVYYDAGAGQWSGAGISNVVFFEGPPPYVTFTTTHFSAFTVTKDSQPIAEFLQSAVSADEGGGQANLVVQLDAAPGVGNTVTVQYSTANGSATGGQDYQAVPSGSVSFTGNETSKPISVPVLDDNADEPDETFTVTLTGVQGGQLGSGATATVTVVDNDATMYTLTTDVRGGGIIAANPPGPSFAAGTGVTVTAVASPGWRFDHWEGALTGAGNPAQITMDGDKTVVAVFVQTGGGCNAGALDRGRLGNGFSGNGLLALCVVLLLLWARRSRGGLRTSLRQVGGQLTQDP